MATLPDVSQSCVQMAITWHLGRAQPDAVSTQQTLGTMVQGKDLINSDGDQSMGTLIEQFIVTEIHLIETQLRQQDQSEILNEVSHCMNK